MRPPPPPVRLAEEPDKFDKDFNDTESEEEDDDGREENRLRKNERAAKVRRRRGFDSARLAQPRLEKSGLVVRTVRCRGS